MDTQGRKLRWRQIAVAIMLLVGLLAVRPAQAQGTLVDVLTIDAQVINPVVAGYVARGIRTAERDGAVCLVVQLDTPGGLSSSTEEIVRSILNAEVPVVIYVAPRGARAASAGVYITYASHVAAMAPATHIGAATPVAVGEGGETVELSEEMQRKIEEDALAQLRASAQERGRNLEWAELAVREAASATAQEALELNVVEIVAQDLDDLLQQLDGRVVSLAGRSVRLNTAGAAVRRLDMNRLEEFLLVITNPTVAYLLLSLGSLGLWIELSNPGIQFAGVLGGVSILVALYALGTLPVNWAGVLLILLAFVLFAFDIFAATHLVLTTGGVVAFVMGSLLLFHSPDPYLRIPPWLIAFIAGLIAAIVAVIVSAVVRGQRRPVVSGRESLVGAVGRVRRPLDPVGYVFAEGALWQAWSEQPIAAGEEVEVVAVEGLRLRVRPRRGEPGEGG